MNDADKRKRGRPPGQTPPKTPTERSRERRARLAAMRTELAEAPPTDSSDQEGGEHESRTEKIKSMLDKKGLKLTPLLLRSSSLAAINKLAKERGHSGGFVLAKIIEELFDLLYLYAATSIEQRGNYALSDKRLFHIHWALNHLDWPGAIPPESREDQSNES